MKPKIRGAFVIFVSNYRDTQYGSASYHAEWCVATKKYCLSNNSEKIRKFDSYEEAQAYIDSLTSKYKKNREHEIRYMRADNRRVSFYDVSSNSNALAIDLKCS